jgi:hypothetical protein
MRIKYMGLINSRAILWKIRLIASKSAQNEAKRLKMSNTSQRSRKAPSDPTHAACRVPKGGEYRAFEEIGA